MDWKPGGEMQKQTVYVTIHGSVPNPSYTTDSYSTIAARLSYKTP